MRKLNLNDIEDDIIKQNFQNIERDFNNSVFRDGNFKFYNIDVVSGDNKFPHNLGFEPKDVILLSYSPHTVTISFKYDLFDKDYITVTSNGTAKIRVFLGSYKEN